MSFYSSPDDIVVDEAVIGEVADYRLAFGILWQLPVEEISFESLDDGVLVLLLLHLLIVPGD